MRGAISTQPGVMLPWAASRVGAAETIAKHSALCAYCVLLRHSPTCWTSPEGGVRVGRRH